MFLTCTIKTIIISAMFIALTPIFTSNAFAATDTDGDGVIDSSDNCILIVNPLQRDTDSDDYGNFCDPDFNNDLIVASADLAYFKPKFFTTDPDADLNGDGFVNAADLAILKLFFFQPPGPSYIDLPPAPQNVALIVDDGEVTISWDSITGATSYNIYWNTTGSVTTSDSQIATVTSPYVHTGLSNGTTYYYVVTAINSTGEGALSSEVSAIPSTNLSNSSLNGTYLMNGRETDLNASRTEVWKWNNLVTFDGAGGCSFVGLIEKGIIRDDTSGALQEFTGTPDDGACTYSLTSDGTLTLDTSLFVVTYAVSPDANIIFGSGSYAESLFVEAMVKQSSGLNDASLNGTYLTNGQSIELTASTTEVWKWNNEVTFDGEGGCSYVGLIEEGIRRYDASGVLEDKTGTPDNGVCTYSLASDGILTVDGSPTYAVSPDANIIIGKKNFADTVLNNIVLVGSFVEEMVKQSSGLNDASLNGTYLMDGQSTELTASTTEVWRWNNQVTFDGAGGCSYVGLIVKGIVRDETTGTVQEFTVTPDDGVCTYSLASDGTLTLDGSPTYAVSPDTNIIIGKKNFADIGRVGSIVEAMVKTSQ